MFFCTLIAFFSPHSWSVQLNLALFPLVISSKPLKYLVFLPNVVVVEFEKTTIQSNLPILMHVSFSTSVLSFFSFVISFQERILVNTYTKPTYRSIQSIKNLSLYSNFSYIFINIRCVFPRQTNSFCHSSIWIIASAERKLIRSNFSKMMVLERWSKKKAKLISPCHQQM